MQTQRHLCLFFLIFSSKISFISFYQPFHIYYSKFSAWRSSQACPTLHKKSFPLCDLLVAFRFLPFQCHLLYFLFPILIHFSVLCHHYHLTQRAAGKVMNGFLLATSSGQMYFSPYYPRFPFEVDAKIEPFLKCDFLDSFIPSSTHLINIYWAPGICQELEILTVSKADKTLSLPHSTYSLRVFVFFFTLNWTK